MRCKKKQPTAELSKKLDLKWTVLDVGGILKVVEMEHGGTEGLPVRRHGSGPD